SILQQWGCLLLLLLFSSSSSSSSLCLYLLLAVTLLACAIWVTVAVLESPCHRSSRMPPGKEQRTKF
ncbi:hypothetical protein INR49_015094, partial [Caranx melampygus]